MNKIGATLFKKQEMLENLKKSRFNIIDCYTIDDDRVGFTKKKDMQTWIIFFCKK